jgi:hypothetical protein
VVAERAFFQLKDRTPDDKDLLSWKWLKGSVTPKSDFGDPLTTDTYELCVYEGALPTLISHATAPAGGLCRLGKPCWKETTTGFKYLDRELTPLGIQRITLKEGLTPGAAKIMVSGRGVNLDMPSPFPLAPPVTVQLKNSSGVCWQATYGAPATRNTATEFKDKAD